MLPVLERKSKPCWSDESNEGEGERTKEEAKERSGITGLEACINKRCCSESGSNGRAFNRGEGAREEEAETDVDESATCLWTREASAGEGVGPVTDGDRDARGVWDTEIADGVSCFSAGLITTVCAGFAGCSVAVRAETKEAEAVVFAMDRTIEPGDEEEGATAAAIVVADALLAEEEGCGIEDGTVSITAGTANGKLVDTVMGALAEGRDEGTESAGDVMDSAVAEL